MKYSEIYEAKYSDEKKDWAMSHSEGKIWQIIQDLTDRRGLSHEWDNIDEEIQDEIFAVWVGILEEPIPH